MLFLALILLLAALAIVGLSYYEILQRLPEVEASPMNWLLLLVRLLLPLACVASLVYLLRRPDAGWRWALLLGTVAGWLLLW